MLHRSGHSIKNQLRYLFFIGLILDMLLLSFIVFYYWKSSIDEALFFSQEETTRQVVQKISDFMNVPLRMNTTNQYFIASHLISLDEPQTAARFFASVMQPADSNVYSFSYGRADGSYFGVRRNKQNQLEFMRSDKETQYHSVYYALDDAFNIRSVTQQLSYFDPRTRDWYTRAEESRYPGFSNVYQHFVMEDLAISAFYPILDTAGKLSGVLGTHITLDKLNRELSEIVKSKGAQAYIFERQTGCLIANSEHEPAFTVGLHGEFHRLNVNEIKNQAIRQAYEHYQEINSAAASKTTENGDFHLKVSAFTEADLDWLIITAIPENSYVKAIHNSFWLILLFSLTILSISGYIGSRKIDQYFQPIDELIHTTHQFSRGDLSCRAKITAANEISILSAAFNQMAAHLEVLINELEQKVAERTEELQKKNQALREAKENLEHASQTDFLTGLFNRRYMMEKLNQAIADFAVNKRGFAVFMADIDFFKKVNDTFGHDCGDCVLRHMSHLFQTALPKNACLSRWGGEEFLLLLPDVSPDAAFAQAEKIRKAIEEYDFPCGKKRLHITLTLGMTMYSEGKSINQVLKEADIAIYNGKHNGRNRTERFTQE